MHNDIFIDQPRSLHIVNGVTGETVAYLSIVSGAKLIVSSWIEQTTKFELTVANVWKNGKILRSCLLPFAPEQADTLLTMGNQKRLNNMIIGIAAIQPRDDLPPWWGYVLDKVSRLSTTKIFERSEELYSQVYKSTIPEGVAIATEITLAALEQFVTFTECWKAERRDAMRHPVPEVARPHMPIRLGPAPENIGPSVI